MKRSIVMGAFLAALLIGGCTTTPTVAPDPQAQQGATSRDADRRREEDQRREEDRRREEDQRRGADQHRDAERGRDGQSTGCPAGEHRATAPDGRVICVRD